jgi:hypothetical protein
MSQIRDLKRRAMRKRKLTFTQRVYRSIATGRPLKALAFDIVKDDLDRFKSLEAHEIPT